MLIRRADGAEQAVPVQDFYRSPGDTPHLETLLEPGELIMAVRIPAEAAQWRTRYQKVRDRASFAWALASCAAALRLDGMAPSSRRAIAAGGVATRPWRLSQVEAALTGKRLDASVIQTSGAGSGCWRNHAWRQCLQGALAPEHRRTRASRTWRPGMNAIIGQPISRVDGPDKVQGKATYAAEFVLPGLAHAALVLSTIPKGRVTGIDARSAEAAPGVLAVLTHENAPRLPYKPLPKRPAVDPKSGEQLHVLQEPVVQFNGQPIALVVAETLEQATHAADLIQVAYEEMPAETAFDIARVGRRARPRRRQAGAARWNGVMPPRRWGRRRCGSRPPTPIRGSSIRRWSPTPPSRNGMAIG